MDSLKLTQNLKSIIEALLFTAAEPLPLRKLKSIIPDAAPDDLRAAIIELQNEYMAADRAFQIQEIGLGYIIQTLPDYDEWIGKLGQEKRKTRLSPASLETLAIVAYKQPIIRAEVEEIRGVNSDAVIRQLAEKNLITIGGRAETVGRPHFYKTTAYFLEYFGLKNLDDLPAIEEIDKIVQQKNLAHRLNRSLTIDMTPAPAVEEEVIIHERQEETLQSL